MISVSEADKIISSHLFETGSETVHYSELLGRVLAENIYAKRPHPPFDRVTMDGIAINSRDWKNNPNLEFQLQGTQMAGEAPLTLMQDYCIEIMTGAVLPLNSDCVVPVEQITATENGFRIIDKHASAELINPGRNIHAMGSDHSSDDVLIPNNALLNATHLACLLSAGYDKALVKKIPRISIIMSGDELIEPGYEVKDFQIYASNAPSITALLATNNYPHVKSILLKDDIEALKESISTAFLESDVLITTGGVSMGKKDLLPVAFDELGIVRHFHKVTQKPGKPLWFGSYISDTEKKNKTLVFALPGNPVSSLVTARRYVIPALNKMTGLKKETGQVKLFKDVIFNPKLSYFMPVKIAQDKNALLATPLAFNTSGDTVGLTKSDGLVELDASSCVFKAGELVDYFPW